jgi:hypothetical protein
VFRIIPQNTSLGLAVVFTQHRRELPTSESLTRSAGKCPKCNTFAKKKLLFFHQENGCAPSMKGLCIRFLNFVTIDLDHHEEEVGKENRRELD